MPAKIGSMALRQNGDGAIVSLQTAFMHWTSAAANARSITDPEADIPSTRLNDGKVDPQGRFSADRWTWRRPDRMARCIGSMPT